MNRRRRMVFVVIAGLIVFAIAHLIDPSGSGGARVCLAVGLVIGELLVVRLENGTAIPLSYAVILVLAASFGVPEFAVVVIGAELISLALRIPYRSSGWRVQIMIERFVVAAATIAVYDLVRALTNHTETVPAVLIALGAAAVAQVPVDLAVRWVLRLEPAFTVRARLAWLAIASSGMLMAIGYRGVDGSGQVGIWGPLLFSTPLLAAWYSFERLDSATRAYRQTIESLAMAPELGGLVPPGHSHRVAALSKSMAGTLGLSGAVTSDLEMAALLHHVGQVTIDEPTGEQPISPSEVAAVTSAMLREIKPLAGAGDIVAGDADDPRRRVAVQVLRVASDYDDLTARDSSDVDAAIETLRSAPGYVYDQKVLSALERVVHEERLAQEELVATS